MSTTIDEKVVSIQFDNQRFERNVSTTMSTLDKLKQKLNFSGASKGLENVNAAAGKVNMSGLGAAVETVHAKFSALEVIGVTALANITNSAVNAGKRIVSALTIDPIKSGFQEYETQMNAVQTILANTSSKGTTLDDVNAALDELNKYADKTIYNFTEMTRNIGTFTAAGVDLDTSVSAIQGIANLAAVSGSTSQQASTAMYQLSQALATGTVKLQDWNSVVNAGMGGEVFQNALMRTAAVMDGAAGDVEAWKAANVDAYGSFRDSLTQGAWLTTDVLTATLNQFTMAAEEGTEEWEAYKKSLAEQGYTDAQIEEILKMANTATDAATKVKTFTQLWDVLKEAAQSGWAQTWKIIVGDFEEAKALLTPLADFFTGIINKISDARNKLLESALGRGFTELSEKIKTLTKPIEKTSDAITTVVDSVKDYGAVVDEILGGKWGNGQERWDKLAEAGYDWAHAQNLVNEKLGDGTRHATNYKEAQKEVAKTQEEISESNAKQIAELAALDDAKLRDLGYTEEQIKAFHELRDTADKLGLSVEDLITNIDDINGRWLLIESFKNIGKGIIDTFTVIGKAWRDAFPAKDIEERAEGIFNLLAAFHRLTEPLKLIDEETGKLTETGDKLLRTFKGIFAIFDIVATLTGSVFKIGIQIIQEFLKALGYVDIDILGVTAVIGDAIVAFRDWLEQHNLISRVISKVVPLLVKIGKAIVDLVQQAWELPIVQEGVKVVTGAFATLEEKVGGTIGKVIDYLGKLDKITLDDIIQALNIAKDAILNFLTSVDNKYFGGAAGDILSGLANGLRNGAEVVWDAITNLANTLINKFKELLGIHSPSKVFFAIGGFIIAGLIAGLLGGNTELGSTIGDIISGFTGKFDGVSENVKNTFSDVAATISGKFNEIMSGIENVFSNIDWGTLFASGMSVGLLLVLKNITEFMKNISSVSGSLSGVLDNAADFIETVKGTVEIFSKGLKKNLKAKAFKTYTEGFRNIAISILVLAGAIALLTQLDIKKMWNAVGVIAALSVILIGLSFALNKLSQSSTTITRNGIQISGLKSSLLAMGVAMLLMAATVKIIGNMKPEQALQGLGGLLAMVVLMGGLFAAYGKLVKGKAAQNMDKAGIMMRKMATTLLLMVAVIKLTSLLKKDELIKGGACMIAFAVFTLALTAISKLTGKNMDKIGGTLVKIAVAMGLMVGVIKLISFLTEDELIKGGKCMIAFAVFIAALVLVTKIGNDKTIAKVGSTILSVAASMLIMAAVVKILGGMEWGALFKGVVGIAIFSVIIYALIRTIKNVGPEAPKIAATLLAMSAVIAILAGVAIVLSLVSLPGLAKGVVAIGLLAGIMALMIHATKDAQDVKGSIMAMAVAIGIMAASIAVLSFIDPVKIAVATAAIGALMGMFALILNQSKNVTGSMGCLIVLTVAIGIMAAAIAALSFIEPTGLAAATAAIGILMGMFALVENQSKHVTGSMGSLVVMTVLIGVLSAALYLIAGLPVQQTIGAAISLSILMGVMTGVLAIISKMRVPISNAVNAVIGLTLLAVPMIAFAAALCLMKGVNNAIVNAGALSILMTTMSLLLIPLCIIGGIIASSGGVVLLGVVALLAMAVPMVAFVGILALMQNIQNATENANLLIHLMTTMTKILVVLAIVGPLALVGVTAMAALTALIVGIGALATGVGALIQHFPQLESFINTGIPILVKLANGLGQMVSGFLTGLTSGLPEIGTQLSMFMTNAMPFITGVKMVDESVLAGVGILTAAILALTVADLLEGVSAFLNGGTSFSTLGTELSAFMINAMPFIMMSKMIDPSIMEGVKSLAQAVLILTAADVIEGMTSWLTGGSSLSEFGSQLGGLATDLNTFVTNLGTFTDAQVATVNCAGGAIKALAEAAAAIPNEGGWAGKILGENSLAAFGGALPQLGTDLNGFITNLGTFGEDSVTAVDCAGRAITALANAASEIPNDGGLWGKIAGENSLATFANKLPGLGTNLNSFITNLGSFNDSNIATVNCAGEAIKTLASAANDIPNEGGLWAKIVGDNSLATFASKLPGLATNLNSFVKNLGTFANGQIATVGSACSAIRALATLGKEDVDMGNISDFGKKIEGLGGKIKAFTTSVSEAGSENITSAVTKTKELIAMAKSIASTNVDSVSTFGKSLKKVAKEGVEGFVKEFSGESPKSKAKKATKAMLSSAIDGAEDKKSDVKKKFKSIAEAAVDALSTNAIKSDAKEAGKDLVTGFAKGIKAQTFEAEAKAKAMAKAAMKAAEDALGIASPSKEFYKIGAFAGQGLTNALGDYESKSYKSGYSVAEYAKDGLSRALSKVNDLLNSDMDAQPTIRPVLDLSDVAAGAGAINGMFDTQSIGVMSNVRAINSMMNENQNGGNSDIITAIDKLRKDLGNIGGTSYTINGVTYDDGSNISDAVKTIVRAARMERRI